MSSLTSFRGSKRLRHIFDCGMDEVNGARQFASEISPKCRPASPAGADTFRNQVIALISSGHFAAEIQSRRTDTKAAGELRSKTLGSPEKSQAVTKSSHPGLFEPRSRAANF
jgi:hypothetical protein